MDDETRKALVDAFDKITNVPGGKAAQQEINEAIRGIFTECNLAFDYPTLHSFLEGMRFMMSLYIRAKNINEDMAMSDPGVQVVAMATGFILKLTEKAKEEGILSDSQLNSLSA